MKELEEIVSEVGGQGPFQKRLLYLILVPLYFFQPLAWMNELFFLHVPTHWCNHPTAANLTETQLTSWKECYIPKKEIDRTFESCKIVLPIKSPGSSTTQIKCPIEAKTQNPSKNVTVEKSCEWGWNYEKTEFSRTLVTDLNWYCDDAYNIPALFTYSKIGSMVGGVLFNYLGDRFGRKPIFWFVTGMVVICMTIKTFLAEYYWAYVAFKILAASTFVSTYQLPFSIICEVSDARYRTWAILISWLVW